MGTSGSCPLIIGIDPDSEKHGVAVYVDGQLHTLATMPLPEIIAHLLAGWDKALFSIEDVCANNFVYRQQGRAQKAAHAQVARSVGRCQQAQVELMRVLEWRGSTYVLHRPQAGNWAKDKSTFQMVTGWKGRSNADERSAAFFGWLALRTSHRQG